MAVSVSRQIVDTESRRCSRNRVICSMSRVGEGWGNSATKGYFSSLAAALEQQHAALRQPDVPFRDGNHWDSRR